MCWCDCSVTVVIQELALWHWDINWADPAAVRWEKRNSGSTESSRGFVDAEVCVESSLLQFRRDDTLKSFVSTVQIWHKINQMELKREREMTLFRGIAINCKGFPSPWSLRPARTIHLLNDSQPAANWNINPTLVAQTNTEAGVWRGGIFVACVQMCGCRSSAFTTHATEVEQQ